MASNQQPSKPVVFVAPLPGGLATELDLLLQRLFAAHHKDLVYHGSLLFCCPGNWYVPKPRVSCPHKILQQKANAHFLLNSLLGYDAAVEGPQALLNYVLLATMTA